MKKKAILVLAASLVIAFVAGVAARSRYGSTKSKRVAYTIVWQATDYDEAGRGTPAYEETRYVSSNGNWRSVRSLPDGSSEEVFAEVGRGVFRRRSGKGELDFLSAYPQAARVGAEALSASPQFDRRETIFGQETHVLKLATGKDESIEFYRAPALNGDEVKIVHRSGGKTTVVEPVSLLFGEPSADLLDDGRLPVSYEHYEKSHGPRPQ